MACNSPPKQQFNMAKFIYSWDMQRDMQRSLSITAFHGVKGSRLPVVVDVLLACLIFVEIESGGIACVSQDAYYKFRIGRWNRHLLRVSADESGQCLGHRFETGFRKG